MSAKPGTVTVWNSSAAGMTTPSGGQQTNGAADGDILTAGIFDFLHYWESQWQAYLSDGIIQHSDKTKMIHAAAFESENVVNPSAFTANRWKLSANLAYVMASIDLDVGERIKTITVNINEAGASTVTASLATMSAAGVHALVAGTSVTSSGAGGVQALSIPGLGTGVTLLTDVAYSIIVVHNTGTDIVDVNSAKITYDRVTS